MIPGVVPDPSKEKERGVVAGGIYDATFTAPYTSPPPDVCIHGVPAVYPKFHVNVPPLGTAAMELSPCAAGTSVVQQAYFSTYPLATLPAIV